eukprot:TRINITY_DN9358_c0_g1_i1.p1 TRINITY_DN9358_c0_g1~~TRINITY_DN9358_c0_g1_i1.p1  ORF type:complete len:423 (-),score=115.98 TRINITY_DN9358_c0_g1_i1:45-1313(-)
MDLCVRNGMFTASFIKEALGKFRGFVDEVLRNSYQGCLGSDAMIAAPNVMSAYHVAEKLKIPFFGAFTMPYTKTSQYPHAFAVPETPKGQMYNTMTHVIIQSVFWQPIRGQVNQFRGEIGLPSIGAAYGDPYYSKRIPFLYCFSPLLVPKPPDWGDEVNVCGYWFLESPPSSWTPPEKLLTFIAEGTEPPIYIGFGSIVVADPDGLTQAIFQAVSLSKTRAIVVKGWGGLGNVEVPDNIYLIDSVPHEWLFPQMRAVVHHGGAGTTAAGLRFGKPTIIVPFFGDQFFWAQRISEMGLGASVSQKALTSSPSNLAEVITKTLSNFNLLERVDQLGQKIRSESGISNAVNAFYRYLPYSYVPPYPVALGNKGCEICEDTTTAVYCKACGKVFCEKCAFHEIPIPKFFIDTPVRVCNNCFQELSS